MQEQIKQIASRIRELREICGYTSEEIAAALGVEPLIYSSYEQEGTDIPISVLYELSNKFGVDLTEILTGTSPKLNTYCVAKGGKGISIDRYPGYHFESLAHKFRHRMMEPLMITVEPDNADHKPVVHDGQEFNYVVEGTVMVTVGDEEIVLEAGDSIYFNPLIPHGQKALNGKRAKFLTVISE